MNLWLVVVLLIVGTTSVQSQPKKKNPSGIEKVLKTMFPSASATVTPKTKTKKSTKKTPQKESKTSPIYTTVDPEWMAHYWESEAAWDYYIPEDNLIRFKDGKYIVPIVVYKHNEDMARSPSRTPSPAPIPRLDMG